MNILIVEDSEETLSFLRQALSEEGYVVDSAPDGNTGQKKALANDYDVIILDKVLTGRTGTEL